MAENTLATIQNKITVRRKDIYLVAALESRGIQIDHHEREIGSNKIVFIMMGDGIDDLEKEWLSGTMMVNAVRYKESIQRVKAILFSYPKADQSVV